jgi:hypothetical protein
VDRPGAKRFESVKWQVNCPGFRPGSNPGAHRDFMDRREFFRRLAMISGALTLDPEFLLWVPGKKTIFIPPEPEQSLIILPHIPFTPQWYLDFYEKARQWLYVETNLSNEMLYELRYRGVA